MSLAAGLGLAAMASGLAGCGGSGSANAAHCSHPVASGSATFIIDGKSAVTTTGNTCPYTATYSGDHRLDYSGPTGCKGQYFFTATNIGFDIQFRYSARDAFMVMGSDVYHFIDGAQQQGDKLVFDQTFPGHHLAVTINCPPPPPSGPLLPPNY